MFSFDDLTFNSATAAKGGNIVVNPDPVNAVTPQIFIDGNPTFLGSERGVNPNDLISIDPGKHTVTLTAPGFEAQQQIIDVVTGQDTVINTNLVAVTTPTFTTPTTLQAAGSPIDVGSRAAPYITDWDDDGLNDLIVGNDAGDIQLFLNNASNTAPQYGPAQTILSGLGANASPFILDFYEDHNKDLVVGLADGSVKVFYNEGTDAAPLFGNSQFDSTLTTLPTGITDANPFLLDFDQDGRKDLLVGGSDGNVYLFENQRLDASPDFTAAAAQVVASIGTGHAAPSAAFDWDGDGLMDLLVGDDGGFLNLFLNQGSATNPLYSSFTQLTDPSLNPLNVGAFARPLIGDFNGDSIKDMLVGNAAGNVLFYDGTGNSMNIVPLPASAWMGLSLLTAMGLISAARKHKYKNA